MTQTTGRPSKWNSPTKSIRVPGHLVDQLLAIARQLDKPTSPSFVRNSGPYMVTLEDGTKTNRYIVNSPPDLTPSQWAEVEELVEKISNGLTQKELTLLLMSLLEEWGEDLQPL